MEVFLIEKSIVFAKKWWILLSLQELKEIFNVHEDFPFMIGYINNT